MLLGHIAFSPWSRLWLLSHLNMHSSVIACAILVNYRCRLRLCTNSEVIGSCFSNEGLLSKFHLVLPIWLFEFWLGTVSCGTEDVNFFFRYGIWASI